MSALGLFKNNITASMISLVIGVVPFLFLSLMPLALNGWVLGLVCAIAGDSMNVFLVFFVSILPHGIFEIPAFLISASLGIFLCFDITARILRIAIKQRFGVLLLHLARVAVLIVLPLIFSAAFIVAFITPFLIEIFL